MSELIGQTIGNYQIEALLGSGGMGRVYRARHIHLDRLAALKVMHDNLASDPGFEARFRQEAKAIAALQHPNIVEVYDFGKQGDRCYLVLELLTDGSLRALLQGMAGAGQAWPLLDGLDLVRQAAEGLAYAHDQGMVHRDIKPDNMLLKRPGGAAASRLILKITDFGLARLAAGSVMTATGATMGTPAYMSPEQCQGLALDGRSDIYALGVVLYELATGYLPFAVKTMSEAVYKHVNTPPAPPRQLRPDLPVPLEDIILRCLAKQPAARFASAADLAQALAAQLHAPSVALQQATIMTRVPAATPPTPPAPGATVLAAPTGSAAPPIRSLAGPAAAPRIQVL